MIDETASADRSRLIFLQLAGFYGIFAPLSYLIIRLALALILLPDGWEKIFDGGVQRIANGNIAKLGLAQPYAWAWTVACLEFFGSILLGLGLFTRPVAVAFVVMLCVIAFGNSAPRGLFWTSNGAEIAVMMALVLAGFIFGGGGRFSLDRLIGREF
jgi:putative oxidoreductase